MNKIYTIFVLFNMLFAFAACGGGDDGETKNEDQLLLEVDKTALLADGVDKAVFSVKYNGEDVTLTSLISVSAEATSLKGNIFSTKKAGSYIFRATFEGKKSNDVTVTVGNEQVFQKNLLFQMFTSVDCAFCPSQKKLLSSIRSDFPDEVFIVCYHGNLQVVNPFATRESVNMLDFLWDELGSKGKFAPTYYDYIARIDSKNMKDVVGERLTVKGNQGIALFTSLEGNKAKIQVKVKSLVPLEGDYRLVVVLAEDNCSYEGSRFDDIFRHCLTDMKGDKLASLEANGEWVKTYEKSIEVDYKKEEMSVIAYLIRYDSAQKEVVNCQGVKLGQDRDYQTCAYDPNRDPWDEIK